MRTVLAGRALGIVTLVVAALLGSAFALGRSLVPDPRRHSTGTNVTDTNVTGTDAGPSRFADQSPVTSSTTAAPEPNDRDTAPPVTTESDGPYGSRMTTGSPEVALTFDDGPDPRYTPQTLAALRKHHVKATFCLIGENVQNHPDLVRAIVADGHTLCNHSWGHDMSLGKRSRNVILADLLRTNKAIRAAAPGAQIAYFRQPGGNWTYPVVSVAQKLGMTSLHWTVDPSDWRVPGAARIAATVAAGTEPGSIVLLHDAGGNRQGTVDALRSILPDLTSRFQLEALPVDTT